MFKISRIKLYPFHCIWTNGLTWKIPRLLGLRSRYTTTLFGRCMHILFTMLRTLITLLYLFLSLCLVSWFLEFQFVTRYLERICHQVQSSRWNEWNWMSWVAFARYPLVDLPDRVSIDNVEAGCSTLTWFTVQSSDAQFHRIHTRYFYHPRSLIPAQTTPHDFYAIMLRYYMCKICTLYSSIASSIGKKEWKSYIKLFVHINVWGVWRHDAFEFLKRHDIR